MDPSQKAAEPLNPVAASTLVRVLSQPEGDPANDSPEAQENRARAANEASMVFELKDSRAFQWFEREFIERPYAEAFAKLRDPNLRGKEESLENIQTTYVALRKVRVGLLEREIAHRELLDPSDSELPRLRLFLSTL